ncbi:hypothetical protein Pcinc_015918 [Petrolisthes cinctipes]|uniref:Uncharacterized protein n=1 Tax=Petrolisthes cinctipes TaxID=88211 RepID=A0AAE1FS35_PETCI|nr:hypothetical protein Pcinc_015918 [Petrolisthes cinctipes]
MEKRNKNDGSKSERRGRMKKEYRNRMRRAGHTGSTRKHVWPQSCTSAELTLSPYIRPTQQAAAGRGGARGAESTARGYEGGDGLGRVAGVVGHDSCKQRQQGRPPRGE